MQNGYCGLLWTVFLLFGSSSNCQFEIAVEPYNLGNYYFALTNSLWVASKCKTACIVTQPRPQTIFRPRFQVVLPVGAKLSQNVTKIHGSFYYSVLAKRVPSNSPTIRERINTMCSFVESIHQRLAHHVNDDLAVFIDNNTLVAHIRSGDIFTNVIHKKYWQPPLGFYQFAARLYPKILICSQTRHNPTVDAFYQFCVETRGIENCMLRVGKDIVTDVAVLISAHNLAIGYGTFGAAMYALAKNLKRLYYQPSEEIYLDRPTAMEGEIRCGYTQRVTGIKLLYNETQLTMNKDWTASPQQLAALLLNDNQLIGLRAETNENFI